MRLLLLLRLQFGTFHLPCLPCQRLCLAASSPHSFHGSSLSGTALCRDAGVPSGKPLGSGCQPAMPQAGKGYGTESCETQASAAAPIPAPAGTPHGGPRPPAAQLARPRFARRRCGPSRNGRVGRALPEPCRAPATASVEQRRAWPRPLLPSATHSSAPAPPTRQPPVGPSSCAFHRPAGFGGTAWPPPELELRGARPRLPRRHLPPASALGRRREGAVRRRRPGNRILTAGGCGASACPGGRWCQQPVCGLTQPGQQLLSSSCSNCEIGVERQLRSKHPKSRAEAGRGKAALPS